MNVVTRRTRGLVVAVALLGIAGRGNAQSWSGHMSGANEGTPNSSTATGFALLSLVGNSLSVQAFWNNLIGGPASAGHIHCCAPPGTNAGVAIGFPGLSATTSGTFSRTFDLLDPAVYGAGFLGGLGGGTAAGARAALIGGLNTGNAYVNIHNATYPGGEIRANVALTPEPASLALLATGLIVVAGAGLKRRRRS